VLVAAPVLQPASINAETAATAAIEINEVFFISFPSILLVLSPKGCLWVARRIALTLMFV
jgi:hypothetical protein